MQFVDIHFDTIDSTQNWAKANSAKCDPNKITCITADEQTGGRGRFQRAWQSPKGQNLYVTFVFRLPINTLHLISIGQVLAVSVAKLLIRENLLPKIKWPNDILLSGKKMAGILCETSYGKDHVEIFLGIGINVNMDKETLSKIDQPATSLKNETGKEWDHIQLLENVKKCFGKDLELFKKEGFTPFHSPFENLMAYKGEEIKAFDGKQEWTGICHSLTNDGQLNLYLPANGDIKTIYSGDIKNASKV